MKILTDNWKVSGALAAKQAVAKTSLVAVGVAFELAAKYSQDVRDEVATWRDNLVFAMGVLPNGPYITIQKTGHDQVKYLGSYMQMPDVAILFKNFDCALMVFTGQMGTHIAAAERRFIIRGNIGETMSINRALGIVQSFLFPGIIVQKTFRRVPEPSTERTMAKFKVLAALTPALALKAFK
ncbi:MAG TPA: hypothetical protein PK961_08335 [bacterium]|nr:hypothetical protein [bacterium]